MSGRDRALVRVRAVLRAAARLVDRGDELGRRARDVLPEATGLSAEGVELALARHVETAASDDELNRLLAWAGVAPAVHVVLSAHVFVAAVRSLALAVAASESVSVKPSRREPAFTLLLAEAAAREGVAVRVVSAIEPRPGDHVHAYGRDDSLAAIARALPAGTTLRGHGAGLGLAALGRGADVDDAAARLSWDVVAFDQRGCLSPRIVLVDDAVGAARVARALADALDRRGGEVPRGALSGDERTAIATARDSAQVAGAEVHEVRDALVVLASEGGPLVPLPAGRVVLVAPFSDAGDVPRRLRDAAPFVTTIGLEGSGAIVDAARAATPRARAARWGELQRPPLDGPADPR